MSDSTNTTETENLVVASKIKAYVKAASGMNTSAGIFGPLSAQVKKICDQAIERAKADGRKTVMDRDFETQNN